MNTNRIMVFYDGAYFRQGQIYFRYKEKRGWFSLPQLHSCIEHYVAGKMKLGVEITKVVGAHYYDGRPTTRIADAEQLTKERNFEMALMSAGIVPHYLELSEAPKSDSQADDQNYRVRQKGVDVELALDALDYGHGNRFDAAVLITGDRDFVPLVRKLTSLDKQVVIGYFEFQGWDDTRNDHHRSSYCSPHLLDAATSAMNFCNYVKDRNYKEQYKGIFFMPKSDSDEL